MMIVGYINNPYKSKTFNSNKKLFTSQKNKVTLQMNQEPVVSIIMAAYNAEKFIEGTLKTALSQNYDNYNVIVVNDGSTDNTNQIVQDMTTQYPKLKLITMPRNRGQFYARALALKHASEFVMFQDADDDLTSDIVRTAVQKQQETNTDIVFFKTNVLDVASGAIIPGTPYGQMFPTPISGKGIFAMFEKVNSYYPLWGKLYRKELLEFGFSKLNILLGNRITFAEDYVLQSVIFNRDISVVGIDLVGYIYRVFPDSVCNRKSDEADFTKLFQFFFTKMYATKNMQPIKEKFGIALDLYATAHARFQAHIPLMKDLTKQLQVLQVYSEKMFDDEAELKKSIQEAWDKFFFSRCKLENGKYVEIDGTQTIDKDLVVGSKIVEKWKGKTVADYAKSNITFQNAMDIAEEIWHARENGEDVNQETDGGYRSWFENYQLLLQNPNATLLE
uniref:Glycosyl transferase family 2 protein n=1 Tax=Trepomonas sp. PC1 TaxID=1076344 RepID=A0A146K3F3_9EUKA|eukprot:JAP91413.1 Glycosyl transferase family 2 protein [Trepomonas sp. PC1]